MNMVKAELINLFMHLCRDLGKKAYVSESDLKALDKWLSEPGYRACEIVPYNTNGCWFLDYASCYGGWMIKERCGESGECDPVGSSRSSIQEMYKQICFAREFIQILKKGHTN